MPPPLQPLLPLLLASPPLETLPLGLFHCYLILEQFAKHSRYAAAAFRYLALLFTAVFVLVRSVASWPTIVWYSRKAWAAASVPTHHRILWVRKGWVHAFARRRGWCMLVSWGPGGATAVQAPPLPTSAYRPSGPSPPPPMRAQCATGCLVAVASQGFSHGFVTRTWQLWKEHLAERRQSLAAAAQQATARAKLLAEDSACAFVLWPDDTRRRKKD